MFRKQFVVVLSCLHMKTHVKIANSSFHLPATREKKQKLPLHSSVKRYTCKQDNYPDIWKDKVWLGKEVSWVKEKKKTQTQTAIL